MKVVLLPQAQKDLDLIYEPLLSKIIRQLQTLKEFPQMGVSLLGPFAGYRSLVIDFFRVTYRILPDQTIEVAYIRDCRQRPLH